MRGPSSRRGGNSKSAFSQLCASFVGERNVVHLTLQRLESDRFAAARLYGRLANTGKSCARLAEFFPTAQVAGANLSEEVLQHPSTSLGSHRVTFREHRRLAAIGTIRPVLHQWSLSSYSCRRTAANSLDDSGTPDPGCAPRPV